MQMEKKTSKANLKKATGSKPDRLDELMEHLQLLRNSKFTGYIKINYSQGAIARIEKFEEILRKLK